jgi:hypothetical protein
LTQSIDDKIIKKVKKAARGSLFFTEDFLSFGSAKSVANTLERLVHHNDLQREARGVYARLAVYPFLGLS